MHRRRTSYSNDCSSAELPAKENVLSDDIHKQPISNSLKDYKIIREIGRGQFGTVHEVVQYNNVDGRRIPIRTMAWKIVSFSRMEVNEVRQLQREVKLCESLNHPNVVRFFGWLMDKRNKRICVAMEHCGGGDLGRYLNMTVRQKNPLPEKQILIWCSQLIEALHHCHSRPSGAILHRDIKPQNVLLDSTCTNVKLADFGLAKLLKPQERLASTHVGTPYYMSPEVLNRQEYDVRSDVWSLGCVLYELACGSSPYGEAVHYEHLRHLVQTRDPRPLPLGPPYGSNGYSMDLTSLIMSMLHRDVTSRPDTKALRSTLLMKYARALSYRHASQTLVGKLNEAETVIAGLRAEIKSLKMAKTKSSVSATESVRRSRYSRSQDRRCLMDNETQGSVRARTDSDQNINLLGTPRPKNERNSRPCSKYLSESDSGSFARERRHRRKAIRTADSSPENRGTATKRHDQIEINRNNKNTPWAKGRGDLKEVILSTGWSAWTEE